MQTAKEAVKAKRNYFWTISRTEAAMQTVKEVLQIKGNNVWTISKDDTVYRALEIMNKKGVGALPITNSARQVIGILSERDYARKVILEGKASRNTLVKDIMATDIYVVKPTNKLDECMAIMTEKRVRHLPVVENGKLVGIISIGDVLKAIISEQHIMINHLENYIQGKYV